MLGGLADHEHIYASLTDNLVGELGAVTLDVLRLGSVHAEKAIQTLRAAAGATDAQALAIAALLLFLAPTSAGAGGGTSPFS
jgi:hypothetical protein